jgi:hypothetical protein
VFLCHAWVGQEYGRAAAALWWPNTGRDVHGAPRLPDVHWRGRDVACGRLYRGQPALYPSVSKAGGSCLPPIAKPRWRGTDSASAPKRAGLAALLAERAYSGTLVRRVDELATTTVARPVASCGQHAAG